MCWEASITSPESIVVPTMGYGSTVSQAIGDQQYASLAWANNLYFGHVLSGQRGGHAFLDPYVI